MNLSHVQLSWQGKEVQLQGLAPFAWILWVKIIFEGVFLKKYFLVEQLSLIYFTLSGF